MEPDNGRTLLPTALSGRFPEDQQHPVYALDRQPQVGHGDGTPRSDAPRQTLNNLHRCRLARALTVVSERAEHAAVARERRQLRDADHTRHHTDSLPPAAGRVWSQVPLTWDSTRGRRPRLPRGQHTAGCAMPCSMCQPSTGGPCSDRRRKRLSPLPRQGGPGDSGWVLPMSLSSAPLERLVGGAPVFCRKEKGLMGCALRRSLLRSGWLEGRSLSASSARFSRSGLRQRSAGTHRAVTSSCSTVRGGSGRRRCPARQPLRRPPRLRLLACAQGVQRRAQPGRRLRACEHPWRRVRRPGRVAGCGWSGDGRTQPSAASRCVPARADRRRGEQHRLR